jgi:hypothetical protein
MNQEVQTVNGTYMYLDLLRKPMECHIALHSLQPGLDSTINTQTSAMGAMTAIAAVDPYIEPGSKVRFC